MCSTKNTINTLKALVSCGILILLVTGIFLMITTIDYQNDQTDLCYVVNNTNCYTNETNGFVTINITKDVVEIPVEHVFCDTVCCNLEIKDHKSMTCIIDNDTNKVELVIPNYINSNPFHVIFISGAIVTSIIICGVTLFISLICFKWRNRNRYKNLIDET